MWKLMQAPYFKISLVTPDDVNSLTLHDLNSLTNVTLTFSGNNQTAFQMRHNEWYVLFLVSFIIFLADGSTRGVPAI